jgi:hypothetical protein
MNAFTLPAPTASLVWTRPTGAPCHERYNLFDLLERKQTTDRKAEPISKGAKR